MSTGFPDTLLKSYFETGDKPTQLQFLQLIDAIKEIDDNGPLNNFVAAVAPTSNDDSADGYSVGSLWYNTVSGLIYVNMRATVGNALWMVVQTNARNKIDDIADLRDWGLTETTADQASIIQAAIDEIGDAGGGHIIAPPWTIVSSQIQLREKVWLSGYGKATVFKTAPGTNDDLFVPKNYLTTGTDDQDFILSHFKIDGNSGNNTSGDGINLSYASGYGANGVSRHQLFMLQINACAGNGVSLGNDTRDTYVNMVNAYFNNGYGFSLAGGDLTFNQCTAAQSGLSGFYITSGGEQLTNCKAWYNGRIERGGGAVTTNGQGFRCRNGSASAELLSIKMTNCWSQENYNGGFLFFGPTQKVRSVTMAGCGSNSDRSYGIQLDGCYDNEIQFSVDVTPGLLYTPTYGANVIGGSADSKIDISAPSDFVGTAAIAGTALGLNDITVAGMNVPDIQTTGASYTMPTSRKREANITADQNLTIGNPTTVFRGLKTRYVILQNGTGGYSTTWGSAFKRSATAFTTTANTATIIDFEYNGTYHLETNISTGIVGA